MLKSDKSFPDKPITKKPLEVRQGKGKGNVEYWVAQVKPGMVLYEMEGVSEEVAREALRLAGAKLFCKNYIRYEECDVSKVNELRGKSLDELSSRLIELRKKQFSLRMQMGSGQGVRASEVRETRKNIARIKTVMKENEQGKNPNG